MSDVYGTWLYPLQDWWRTSWNVKFHVHRTDGRFHFSPCEVNHNRPEREHQYMCSDQCVEMWFVDCSTEVRTCKCAAKEHHAHGSMQVLAVPITGTRYRGNKVGGCSCLAPPRSLSGLDSHLDSHRTERDDDYTVLTALRDEEADVDSPCSRLLPVLHFCEG